MNLCLCDDPILAGGHSPYCPAAIPATPAGICPECGGGLSPLVEDWVGICTCPVRGGGEDPTIVLGADDPEMQAIEGIARDAGIPVIHATVGGERPRGASAYQCDAPEPAAGQVWVECAPGAGGRAALAAAGCLRLDHHAPGDPGFGRSPANFLAGSSLGQVIACLGHWNRLAPVAWTWGFRAVSGAEFDGPAGRLVVGRFGAWIVTTPGRGLPIPIEIRLCAAADHCLAAAYRDECPGVDPGKLARWRAETRAVFQGVEVDALRTAQAAAAAAIRIAPQIRIGGIAVADLRPVGTIPEAVEGSMIAGIPILAEVVEKGRGGAPDRRKIVCLGATTPELIRAFLYCGGGATAPSWAEAAGLVEPYGDPERGYAGAYKKEAR